MKSFEGEYRRDAYMPPSGNRYVYDDFREEEQPAKALLARQIQAQSYLNSGFVRQEGLLTLENGAQILAPDIATPSRPAAGGSAWMEYSIGVRKDTTDVDPLTGDMVAWRKYHAPLNALPAYGFCRDNLWQGWEEYLREVDADPAREFAEPEGLGKTLHAGGRVVTEFMRNEIQRAQGRGEVWLMGLVESTVSKMWTDHWGPLAVRQAGEPRRLKHPHVAEDVRLVPTVMDIDNFFPSYYEHLKTLGDRLTLKQLAHFVYMADGIGDTVLGAEIAGFRERARSICDWRENPPSDI